MRRWLLLPAALLANLLLLPLVLLLPPLGRAVQRGWLPALGAPRQRVPKLLVLAGAAAAAWASQGAWARPDQQWLPPPPWAPAPLLAAVALGGGLGLALGLGALAGGPYKPHTASAKATYSEYWRLEWASLYLLDKRPSESRTPTHNNLRSRACPAEADRSHLISFFLSFRPFFQFWLTIGCNLALAALLTLLPSPEV